MRSAARKPRDVGKRLDLKYIDAILKAGQPKKEDVEWCRERLMEIARQNKDSRAAIKALDLMIKAEQWYIEYHAPKTQKIEHSGIPEVPGRLEVVIKNASR